MSSLNRDLDNFLYFGGPLPNLAEGVAEVPLPTMPKKIDVIQISQEYRAQWLFGETYWRPERVAVDWPEIMSC